MSEEVRNLDGLGIRIGVGEGGAIVVEFTTHTIMTKVAFNAKTAKEFIFGIEKSLKELAAEELEKASAVNS